MMFLSYTSAPLPLPDAASAGMKRREREKVEEAEGHMQLTLRASKATGSRT